VDKLLAKSPHNATWQHSLSNGYHGIGRVQAARGKLGEALAALQADKAIMEKVVARAPDNADLQLDPAVSYRWIGRVLEAQGKLGEALAAYEAGKAIMDKLVLKSPVKADWQRQLAALLRQVGGVLNQMDRGSEAFPLLTQAQSIVGRPELGALAVARRDTIEIEGDRIGVFLARGDVPAAREACALGGKAAQRAEIHDGAEMFWGPSIAALDTLCAEVAARAGDRAGALKEVAVAIGRLRDLSARSPDSAAVRSHLGRAEALKVELGSGKP
jgi:tetratricopeptide (TPR) repeat protein